MSAQLIQTPDEYDSRATRLYRAFRYLFRQHPELMDGTHEDLRVDRYEELRGIGYTTATQREWAWKWAVEKERAVV